LYEISSHAITGDPESPLHTEANSESIVKFEIVLKMYLLF
jgi:hypothetical protein